MLSGSPTLTSYNADIYLDSGKVITIESGKPLTNTTPYRVYTPGQVVTSGWANMGGAVPSDYLTSVKSGYGGVCLNPAGEVQLVRALSLDDTQDNTSTIANGMYYNTLLNFTLSGRTFTSASFNTLCLPFALTDEQLQTVFGAVYDCYHECGFGGCFCPHHLGTGQSQPPLPRCQQHALLEQHDQRYLWFPRIL